MFYNEERRKLAAEKKALYAAYHAAQRDMREAVAVKTNIDHLLGITAPGRDLVKHRPSSPWIARAAINKFSDNYKLPPIACYQGC